MHKSTVQYQNTFQFISAEHYTLSVFLCFLTYCVTFSVTKLSWRLVYSTRLNFDDQKENGWHISLV